MRGGSWIACRRVNPRARVRLFCYPHAGGGASAFAAWRQHLPEEVELCPIEPPGRWSRHREEPLRRIDDAAQGVVADIQDVLDLPYVLLGHSLGGFVMFEVARRLSKLPCRGPGHLIVVARNAPQVSSRGELLHPLPDEELLRRLAELYGAQRVEVLADPDLRAHFLPAVRADLEALETYSYTGTDKLTIPLSACGGRSDIAVTEDGVAAWAAHTVGGFYPAFFEGDHFFLHERNNAFFDHLTPVLKAAGGE